MPAWQNELDLNKLIFAGYAKDWSYFR